MEDMLREADAEDDDEYDHPNNSVWIIATDDSGESHVMVRPNIHWSFFENGTTTEELGMRGLEVLPCGVHEVTVLFSTSTDWETGYVDDTWFDYSSHKPLWKYDEIPA